MVIVPLDEASKAIYGEGEEITNTIATEGKVFIDGNEIGELTDFKFTPLDIPKTDNSWIFDMPKSISGTLKVIWKNKIEEVLGFTHYAKKGKLFRKKNF